MTKEVRTDDAAFWKQRFRAPVTFVEVHWFEAGHGSFVVEQQIEHQEIMLRFADRILD
jgi:hypothetical protein